MSSSDKIHTGEDYYKNFFPKNWGEDTVKQLVSLDELEKHMAGKQDRDKTRKTNATLGDYNGAYAYGNPDIIKINLERLNKDYNKSGEEQLRGMSGYFAMATGIHEGIHAGQHCAINNDKKLKNKYDKTTLGIMGQDFFYNKDTGYIVRPVEIDARTKTFAELLDIREKIAKEFPEELKKYDGFLNVYNKQNEDKIREALDQLEVNDLKQAEQKIIERIDSHYKYMKGEAENSYGEIRRFEGKREKLSAELNELKAERKKTGVFKSKKYINEKIRSIEEEIAVTTDNINWEINRFKELFGGVDEPYPHSPQEVLRQMKGLERGEGLVAKEKGDGLTLSHSVKSSDENKIPESSQSIQSSQSPPDPTEREKNKQTHLNEIKWLNKEIVFLEKSLKTTNHEPSKKSLESAIESLKDSQEKMTKSLQAKHDITPDVLIEYRELVASQGSEAVKRFDYTGQDNARVLADAAHKAVPVPKPSEPSQDTKIQSVQEKIAHDLVELNGTVKELSKQLHSPKKPLDSLEIKKLEDEIAKKREEYNAKFAEVINRPDKEKILYIWERIPKDGLTKDEREQVKTRSPSRER